MFPRAYGLGDRAGYERGLVEGAERARRAARTAMRREVAGLWWCPADGCSYYAGAFRTVDGKPPRGADPPACPTHRTPCEYRHAVLVPRTAEDWDAHLVLRLPRDP